MREQQQNDSKIHAGVVNARRRKFTFSTSATKRLVYKSRPSTMPVPPPARPASADTPINYRTPRSSGEVFQYRRLPPKARTKPPAPPSAARCRHHEAARAEAKLISLCPHRGSFSLLSNRRLVGRAKADFAFLPSSREIVRKMSSFLNHVRRREKIDRLRK